MVAARVCTAVGSRVGARSTVVAMMDLLDSSLG
jgi:hypothetical protein